jgi:hypothetical protein
MNTPPPRRPLLADLFDIRFRYLVTPRLVGCLYLAAIAFVGSATLFAILFLWGLTTWLGWGWWLFAPVILAGGLVALLTVRVILEWVLLVFSRRR